MKISAQEEYGLRCLVQLANLPNGESLTLPQIAELEGIVKKLEEGDLPLEQSLALYERGVQLSRFCHARLEEAERRIEILTDRGELKPAPASLTSESPDK